MAYDDGKISVHDAHQAVAGYARQVENRAWVALSGFVAANSIMILAWVQLYAHLDKHPREILGADALLLILPVVGLLLSVGASSFSARNYAYNQEWARRLESLEAREEWGRYREWLQSSEVKKQIQERGMGLVHTFQAVLLTGTLLCIAGLYIVMVITVLAQKSLLEGWWWALVAVVIVLWVLASIDCWLVARKPRTIPSAPPPPM